MDNLQLDDFTKYKFLSNISFSPDGKNCGFVLNQVDSDNNKYLSNIYILDGHNKTLQLTSLNEEKSFIWKDNDTILFPALREKKHKERKERFEPFTRFYEINIYGGEGKFAFELPVNVKSIQVVSEDNYLISAEFNPMLGNYASLDEEQKKLYMKDLKASKDYEILDEIPFWFNGEGFTNKKRTKLYTYNIKDKKLIPITDDFSNVETYTLNKDHTKIAIIDSYFVDRKSTTTELNIYDLKENKLEKVSPIRDFNYVYCSFIDEKIIFTGTDMKTYGVYENPNIYITDCTGSYYNLMAEFDSTLGKLIGSDCRYGSSRNIKVDGNYLYFITTEDSSSILKRIDIHGNIERLSEPNGSIDGFDVIDGRINFIGLRGLDLQEIYSLNKGEQKLTCFNSWVNQERHISKPEKLTMSIENDIQINGYVIKPVDYKEGNTYPAILYIHGGPKAVFGSIYYHEMQYWANEGYFVFYCNPRGSDGSGNEFSDIRGKYGAIDYDDVMNFTDFVLFNYTDIDKDRLGVTGGSYGGFLTNWIIGQTSRFKAAVSQRSISSWISFFGTCDIGYYFAVDQTSSTPWNGVDKMWNQSPLKYADKVITPTLFINSTEDYRCWIPEGLQMFTALKYHGVESKLVAFYGENHDLSRSGKPTNRIKRLEEITNWFNKYLK